MSESKTGLDVATYCPPNPERQSKAKNWLLAAGLGAVAAFGAAHSARAEHGSSQHASHDAARTVKKDANTWYAPKMKVGDIDTTGFESDNPLVTQKLLDAMVDMGIQKLGLYLPVDINASGDYPQAEMDNFAAHACAQEKAAVQHGLQIYLNVRAQHQDMRLDGIPDQTWKMNRFWSAIKEYMDTFAQCAPGQPLEFGPLNEVSGNQNDTVATAAHYESFLEFVVPKIQAEAASLGITQLTIVGFNLSFTQDPVAFVNAFTQAEYPDPNVPHTKRLMTAFGEHNYDNGSINYQNYGSTLVPAIEAAVGKIPRLFTEYSTGATSNAVRLAAYRRAAEFAACNQNSAPSEFWLFHMINNGDWTASPYVSQDPVTGDLTPNTDLLNGLKLIIAQLENGQVLCTTLPGNPSQPVPVDFLKKK